MFARGPLDIALVFTALGVGMAAPYLVVAAADLRVGARPGKTHPSRAP